MSPQLESLLRDEIMEMHNESPDAGEDIGDFLTALGALFTKQGDHIDKLTFGGELGGHTYQTVGKALDAMANEVAENGFVEVK